MPARRRKDVSDDLKQVVVANSKTGMSYRVIASITGFSLGAIAGILKVRTLLIFIFFWGGGGDIKFHFLLFNNDF
jgi:hypothetical protein